LLQFCTHWVEAWNLIIARIYDFHKLWKRASIIIIIIFFMPTWFFHWHFHSPKKNKKKQNNNYLSGYFFIYFNLVLTLMDSMVFFPPSQSMFV
jgi:hypothetical protein